MRKKPCKVISQDNGEIKIYGNGHLIEIEHEIPEWSDDYESCFKYKGEYYFLSEFTRTSELLSEYDGIRNDSYFSGLLVKLAGSNDCLKVYTYTC